MTAAARVRRAQSRLALLGVTGALAWAGAVLFAGLAAAAVLDVLVGPPQSVRIAVRVAVAALAVGTLGFLLWRLRFVRSVPLVALWIEERMPELKYALVTAVDERFTQLSPTLEPLVDGVDPGPMVRRSARRAAVPALVALAAAALAFAAVPKEWSARRAGGGYGPDGRPVAENLPSRLEPLHATVTPPAYALKAGVAERELDDPTSIAALAGSRVELTGPGEPNGVEARLGDSTVAVSAAGDGWAIGFTLPDSATGLQLIDRQYRRLVVIDPTRDRAPTVQLLRPERDTTVRGTDGSLALDARLGDDLGLGGAWVEYIISSGEGEGNFTFRQGKLSQRRYDDAAATRSDRLRLTVPLARFELKEGDRLSVRAVAVDNNTWSGPDTGYSETRLLRVARRSEYDSLAIEGAPPALDSTLMTLRYLIQLTEELEKGRPKLERKVFVDSSNGLGIRAERLRDRVQQLQADHSMGGLFDRNPLLDTAYLALAQGAGALRVAEPDDALPFLWDALEVLRRYAMAERYYLRGQPPEVLVDLARVRLTGTDTGHAVPRKPRQPSDTGLVRLRRSYAAAFERIRGDPEGAADSLMPLQVEALRTDPALASALGAAIAALRSERDPSPALHRVRRILDGSAAVLDTIPRWSGAW